LLILSVETFFIKLVEYGRHTTLKLIRSFTAASNHRYKLGAPNKLQGYC